MPTDKLGTGPHVEKLLVLSSDDTTHSNASVAKLFLGLNSRGNIPHGLTDYI